MENYDEFEMLVDNATEVGIPWKGQPLVKRQFIQGIDGLSISSLVWGTDKPELVLLHGGGQNAHTWDTVALALNRSLVAIDLPGHGHSDWRPEHDYDPLTIANAIAHVVGALAPEAEAVVGMSLGGLTALCLASNHPDLVRRLGIVDVTPGTDQVKAEPIINFIDGPEYFDDFQSILDRTIEHNPMRSESSLRRGVLHNARELPDGRWSWRYDADRAWKRRSNAEQSKKNDEISSAPLLNMASLWEEVSAITCPVHLWIGGAWSVVGDADVVEFQRRHSNTIVATIDGAGHSIQGDKPLELARLIEDLMTA